MLKKIKNKRSKKNNVSELLNSNQTKINNNKKHIIKKKHIINKNDIITKNIKQKGGSDPFNNNTGEAKDISYFNVSGTFGYLKLKWAVRLIVAKSYSNKITGSITPMQYNIIKSLLYTNLYFSRMRLEISRILVTITKLIRNDDSGIKKVQKLINEIFEIQEEIQKSHLLASSKGVEPDLSVFNSIKKFFSSSKDKDKIIYQLIKKQDEKRLKLMRYSRFDSDKSLTECTLTNTFDREKTIICLLRKYRKQEGKFNLYYNKFRNEYEKFVKAFPPCESEIDAIKLNFLDIEQTKQFDTVFDKSKCDSKKIADNFEDAFRKGVELDDKRLNSKKYQKQKDKMNKISEDFKSKYGKYKALIDSFNKNLDVFKNIIIAIEAYGIRHYKSNISKKDKSIIQKLFTGQRYLIKDEKLTALSSDPKFIDEFIKIIDSLSIQNSDPNLGAIFSNEKTIEKNIIPEIPILTVNFGELKILSINLKNMPFDPDLNLSMWEFLKMENAIEIGQDSFPKILCIQNCDPYIASQEDFVIDLPAAGTHAAGLPQAVVADADLVASAAAQIVAAGLVPAAAPPAPPVQAVDMPVINQYKLAAFSYHGVDKKYNVIFIRKNIIGKDAIPFTINQIKNIKTLDQTQYFSLNYKPESMKLEDTQKSFASASLMFTPNNNNIIIDAGRKARTPVIPDANPALAAALVPAANIIIAALNAIPIGIYLNIGTISRVAVISATNAVLASANTAKIIADTVVRAVQVGAAGNTYEEVAAGSASAIAASVTSANPATIAASVAVAAVVFTINPLAAAIDIVYIVESERLRSVAAAANPAISPANKAAAAAGHAAAVYAAAVPGATRNSVAAAAAAAAAVAYTEEVALSRAGGAQINDIVEAALKVVKNMNGNPIAFTPAIQTFIDGVVTAARSTGATKESVVDTIINMATHPFINNDNVTSIAVVAAMQNARTRLNNATFENPPTKFINIVTTELIGSDLDKDVTHMIDINKFQNDNRIKDGLRGAQIRNIFELIQKNVGIAKPDIICGDLGGSFLDDYTRQIADIIRLVKPKITNPPTDAILIPQIQSFYTFGFDNFNNYNKLPLPAIHYTKNIDRSKSNYILYKNTILAPAVNYGPTNIVQLTNNPSPFGGILPIGIQLNININNNMNDYNITTKKIVRTKKYSSNNIKLYSEDELKNIIRMLDQLMGNFTYGYIPYLKRDLGCLSFDGDDVTVNRSDFSYRKFKTKPPENLKTFYAMSYPSFIEYYLYQLSGFFSNNNSGNVYYSENQIMLGKGVYKSKNQIKLFDKANIDPENIDIIARMLLIPSAHLKEISGIDINDRNTSTNFNSLSQMFSIQYYRDVVLKLLEERLDQMEITSNDGLLFKLKERDGNGYLINIKDPKQSFKLIRRLYEYIFIMLRLKFIDYQIQKAMTLTIPANVATGSPATKSLSGTSGSVVKIKTAYKAQKQLIDNQIINALPMIERLQITFEELLKTFTTVAAVLAKYDLCGQIRDNILTPILRSIDTILRQMKTYENVIKEKEYNEDIKIYDDKRNKINEIIVQSYHIRPGAGGHDLNQWNKSIFKLYAEKIEVVIDSVYLNAASYRARYIPGKTDIIELFKNITLYHINLRDYGLNQILLDFLTIVTNIPGQQFNNQQNIDKLNNLIQRRNTLGNTVLPNDYDKSLNNPNNYFNDFFKKYISIFDELKTLLKTINQLPNIQQIITDFIDEAKKWERDFNIPESIAFSIYLTLKERAMNLIRGGLAAQQFNGFFLNYYNNLYDLIKNIYNALPDIQLIQNFDKNKDNKLTLLDANITIYETVADAEYARVQGLINPNPGNPADNIPNFNLTIDFIKPAVRYILAVDEYIYTVYGITNQYIDEFKANIDKNLFDDVKNFINNTNNPVLSGGGIISKYKHLKSNNIFQNKHRKRYTKRDSKETNTYKKTKRNISNKINTKRNIK